MLPDAFDSYVMWMAMKRHFSSRYDYIKYVGKVPAKREKFEKMNFRSFFYSLATKYKADLKDFFVSVYCKDGNADLWIADIMDDKYYKEFLERQKRVQALTRTFTNDVSTITEFMKETNMSLKDVLMSHNGNLPPIIQMEIRKLVCTESVLVLSLLTGFLEKDCVHPSWDDHKIRLTKLKPFVRIDDIRKYAEVLRKGTNKL